MNEWTPWHEIDKAKSPTGPLDDFGIYQIRIVNVSGAPIPISRFCRIDADGLIYIGRSGFRRQQNHRTIANRIREFTQLQHSGGITYDRIKPLLQHHPQFADHRLQVRGCFLEDGQIKAAETQLLSDYLATYGELPPCNSSLPQTIAGDDGPQ